MLTRWDVGKASLREYTSFKIEDLGRYSVVEIRGY